MPSGTETVLLVEDEAGVRAVIAEGLRGLGYTVEAANGDEALDVVCGYGGVIDLLLADVVMHTPEAVRSPSGSVPFAPHSRSC